MTTAVTNNPAAAPAAQTGNSTALGKARLADNFETFLTLLTTQLKNQDPLSPLDSNQFTQQLVQMSGVEQQLLGNDLLQQLVTNTGTGVATAVGLIGKDVRVATAKAELNAGKAEWVYNLASDATDVKLQITDSAGRVVSSNAPSNNKAGEHTFTWNGKDQSGNTLPDGSYTLQVMAVDGSGATVASTVSIQGLVTAVEQRDGTTYITINGGLAPWDQVTSIKQIAASTPQTPG